MSMLYILSLLTAFVLVFLLVPYVQRLATKLDFVDKPTKRKIHAKPIPLMGGAALYIGIIVCIFLYDGFSNRALTVLAGGTPLVLMGLLDDWFKTKGKEFPVWPRLIVYIVVSSVPIWFGISFDEISNLFGSGVYFFPTWLMWGATMLWVFSITNMINFIDGVDGLSSGIVTISSFTLLIVAILKGQGDSAMLAAIMAGACAAFLLYNFHPAKIFMGDAGAIFLGYTLAVLALDGAFKSTTVISIFVPVLAVGVPILDTLLVFTRRFLSGQGLHKADKLHTHHTLMKWGLSQTQTVSFLYLIGFSFSLLSIILTLAFH
jgi:UDP-GlcNAc:undecaprenyl-phosphate GlcNAc-1-phosphate transferase